MKVKYHTFKTFVLVTVYINDVAHFMTMEEYLSCGRSVAHQEAKK